MKIKTFLFAISILVLGLEFIGCGGKQATVMTSPMVPAAQGDVKVSTDHNGNTKVDLSVKNLAEPSNLSPPESVYMVWVTPAQNSQQQGLAQAAPIPEGALKVGKNLKGSITFITPLRNFEILVTAQQSENAAYPSDHVVMRANVSR